MELSGDPLYISPFLILIFFNIIFAHQFQSAAMVNSGLLLMAVMGLLFPAVLHSTHTELHFGESEMALSRISSCIMLVAYACNLVFQLKSHKNLYAPVDEVIAFIFSCT